MADTGPSFREVRPKKRFRSAFYRGLGISLPILITLIVFFFVLDFLTGLLDPAVVLIQETVGYTERLPDTVIALIALAILLVLILLVGFVAESRYGGGIQGSLETAVTELPGIGAIYTSVDEMSEMLIDSDTESYREVKLIEFPFQGTYALAFLTAGSTGVVGETVGEEHMLTVFLPMAPNPMGGFLMHVPEDRVYDIDLTVEEGVQTVLSTGVWLEADAVDDIETDDVEGIQGDVAVDPDDGAKDGTEDQ